MSLTSLATARGVDSGASGGGRGLVGGAWFWVAGKGLRRVCLVQIAERLDASLRRQQMHWLRLRAVLLPQLFSVLDFVGSGAS